MRINSSILDHCDVQIIGDISTPESDEHTRISADKVHKKHLKQEIKTNLK